MQTTIQATRILLYLVLASTLVLLILQVFKMLGELGNEETQMKAIAVLCFQAGVVVAFTVALALVGLKLTACRATTLGKILAVEVEHSDSVRTDRETGSTKTIRRLRYRAHIEFELNGKPIRAYCLTGAKSAQKGDRVKIFYNPKDPRQARISFFKPLMYLSIPLIAVVYFGWYIYNVGTGYWSEDAIEWAEDMGKAAREQSKRD